MMPPLDARKWQVLRAVIREYIVSGLPVASGKITRKYRLNLSPATVRTTMALLEQEGYLEQPHVSAGRIPSDLAFRYYVDVLTDLKPLAQDVQRLILGRFQDAVQDVGEIMQETSRLLSRVSRCAGVVSAPSISHIVFDAIDFHPLEGSRVLVILVSQAGLLYHRIIDGIHGATRKELEQAAGYLNRHIRGRSLAEAREWIMKQLEQEKSEYREILKRFWNVGTWAIDPGRAEVYIDGQSNILDYPEFADDARKMKALLRAFEQKEILLQLLNKAADGGGIRIYIGHESQCDEMSECAFIVSNYCRGGIPLGSLGIIGPKRMDYSRVIPLVQFAAKAVGEKLGRIRA